jgi:hypothetical protein
MDPELEAILLAYDATKQAAPEDIARLRALYNSKLDDVLQRRPNLSRHSLEAIVRLAHGRWLRAQEKPSSIPPQA